MDRLRGLQLRARSMQSQGRRPEAGLTRRPPSSGCGAAGSARRVPPERHARGRSRSGGLAILAQHHPWSPRCLLRGLGTAIPPPLHQGRVPRGLRALGLVRARSTPLAPDRPDGPAARQRHRGAPPRARVARRGVRDRPRHAATGASSPTRRRSPPRPARARCAARPRRRSEIDARRRQHLHRLPLPRAHRATSSSGSACAPTCRPSTSVGQGCAAALPNLQLGRLAARVGRGDARALGLRRGQQRRDVPRQRPGRADQRLPVRRRRRRGRAARASAGRDAARRSNGRTLPR